MTRSDPGRAAPPGDPDPPGGADRPGEADHSGDAALTCDELLRGRIRVWQPRTGYRVNVDSLLLAWFVGAPPYGRVADLGAGVGVIGLALASRDPAAEVTLAELQPAAARLCQRNLVENGVAARGRVVQVDLADERGGAADRRG